MRDIAQRCESDIFNEAKARGLDMATGSGNGIGTTAICSQLSDGGCDCWRCHL
jgi:hypothetical protein